LRVTVQWVGSQWADPVWLNMFRIKEPQPCLAAKQFMVSILTQPVVHNFTTTQQELDLVRDMGSSILGGGEARSLTLHLYPDGPDVVTVMAQKYR
jgi:hypothetical protein